MSETSFHHIELRDKVWDLLLGWGEVSRIDRYRNEITSFKVLFHIEGRPGEITYNPDGYEFAHSYEARRLFWDEIPIASYAPFPPPKPKKKVLQHGYALITTYKYPRTGEIGMEKIEGPFHDLGVAEAALCISDLITGREKQVVAFTYEVEE